MHTSKRIATVLVSAPLMLGFGTAAAAAILPIGLAPIASADTSICAATGATRPAPPPPR